MHLDEYHSVDSNGLRWNVGRPLKFWSFDYQGNVEKRWDDKRRLKKLEVFLWEQKKFDWEEINFVRDIVFNRS